MAALGIVVCILVAAGIAWLMFPNQFEKLSEAAMVIGILGCSAIMGYGAATFLWRVWVHVR